MPFSAQPRLVQPLILIWKFTESNFPTFVIPNSAFGILSALAGKRLTDCGENVQTDILARRIPLIILFNWANVFIFDLANQRLPEAILEDKLNKPWRPLLTGQITSETTRRVMLFSIPATVAISFVLGVGSESSLIMILTWLYNDLRGGDEIVRDLIISAGYALYFTASLRIGIDLDCLVSTQGYQWILIVGGIILTTMQIQDLKDQFGDKTRGRRTWPLVLGDRVSRWIISSFVLFWSIACPFFWNLPAWGYLWSGLPGVWVTFQVLRKRNDSAAWRYWCVWQIVVYTLPWLATD
ncbi:uncharacterized protein N7483_008346 [Penicillium malachiteum]|uniref:uncharacterized protein n=1 Tax=Penicillium malachiteum TaxID=1324776 RepID=UPI002547ACC6|nr:uncharacterized protein N7483_008346 [Penicillium malachiteum]KAJ5720412.1 hypothetical protein N7483_008346 [Penicillium malachiteum]